MKRKSEQVAWLVLAVCVAAAYQGGSASALLSVTYVYEKNEGSVPPAVLAGINELNRSGITATTFDADTTDGTGKTPKQYTAPLAAAKEAGLPALVAMGPKKVKRVVKAPMTKEQVLGVVK